MTLRVINYARVSTDEQSRNNLSLDEQLKVMRRYAENNGWFIYSEVKESASGFDYDRAYLDTIRDLAKKREFDALLVLRCDRFARDEGVFIVLERFFKKHGIRLFSAEEGEFTPGTINRYLAAIQRARLRMTRRLLKSVCRMRVIHTLRPVYRRARDTPCTAMRRPVRSARRSMWSMTSTLT